MKTYKQTYIDAKQAADEANAAYEADMAEIDDTIDWTTEAGDAAYTKAAIAASQRHDVIARKRALAQAEDALIEHFVETQRTRLPTEHAETLRQAFQSKRLTVRRRLIEMALQAL